MAVENDKKEAPTSARPTFWLIFSVFSAAFGSSFLFGYNVGVLNPPQNIIGHWIRGTKCTGKGGVVSVVEGETDDLWCAKLGEVKESTMFVDNTELNTLWALLNCLVPGGAVIGALSSSFFVGRFGPKKTLLLNNILAIIAVLLTSLSRTAGAVEVLIIGRFFAGINLGLNAGVPPTYLNEIAPLNLRGAIGSVHQLSITTGVFVAQIFGLPFILGNSDNWPYLMALAVMFTAYQLATLPFCPDSPKFLFFKQQDEEGAKKAVEKFAGHANAEKEMQMIRSEYALIKDEPTVSVRDLFTDAFLRRTLFITLGLMACQQFSGIDAVMFYSTAIFRSAGMQGNNALYATIGMSGMLVLMTTIALGLVEKAGRRILLIIGFAGMVVCLVVLTISMLLFKSGLPTPENPSATNSFAFAAYVSTVSLIGYVVMFAVGPGAIPWIMMSELFAQGPRAAAAGIASGTNRFCSLIIALSFPYLQAAIEEYCFIIFAVLNFLSIIFTYFYIIETKGKSTDEIQRELRSKMSRRASAVQEWGNLHSSRGIKT